MSETTTQPEPRLIAWFVCRAAGITDDIELPLKAGIARPTDAVAFKQGRMRAARVFKQRHGLHPCRKVDCELQAVMPAEAR